MKKIDLDGARRGDAINLNIVREGEAEAELGVVGLVSLLLSRSSLCTTRRRD